MTKPMQIPIPISDAGVDEIYSMFLAALERVNDGEWADAWTPYQRTLANRILRGAGRPCKSDDVLEHVNACIEIFNRGERAFWARVSVSGHWGPLFEASPWASTVVTFPDLLSLPDMPIDRWFPDLSSLSIAFGDNLGRLDAWATAILNECLYAFTTKSERDDDIIMFRCYSDEDWAESMQWIRAWKPTHALVDSSGASVQVMVEGPHVSLVTDVGSGPSWNLDAHGRLFHHKQPRTDMCLVPIGADSREC